MPKGSREEKQGVVKIRHELLAVSLAALTVLFFISATHRGNMPIIGRAAGGLACSDAGGDAGCHKVCEDLFSIPVLAGDAFCQDTTHGRAGRCCAMIDLVSCSSKVEADAWCMDSCSGDFDSHAPEGDMICGGKVCCTRGESCEEAGGTAGCRDDCRQGIYPVRVTGGDRSCQERWGDAYPLCCAYI